MYSFARAEEKIYKIKKVKKKSKFIMRSISLRRDKMDLDMDLGLYEQGLDLSERLESLLDDVILVTFPDDDDVKEMLTELEQLSDDLLDLDVEFDEEFINYSLLDTILEDLEKPIPNN